MIIKMTLNLKKLNKPRALSTSQLTCYKSCPRKYNWQYIKRMRPLVTSDALNNGLTTHNLIAQGIFDLNYDPDIHASLQIAKAYLEKSGPQSDRLMEYKIFGTILDKHNAVGIMDVIWPFKSHITDWKGGVDKQYKRFGYDIQAYIYTKLFEQEFGKPLESFDFVFFGDNSIYQPKITSDKFLSKNENRIADILKQIEEDKEFNRIRSPLCNYCQYQPICEAFE